MQVYGGYKTYTVEIKDAYRNICYAWIGYADDVFGAIEAAKTLLQCYIVDPISGEWPDKIIIKVTKGGWILHFEEE